MQVNVSGLRNGTGFFMEAGRTLFNQPDGTTFSFSFSHLNCPAERRLIRTLAFEREEARLHSRCAN